MRRRLDALDAANDAIDAGAALLLHPDARPDELRAAAGVMDAVALDIRQSAADDDDALLYAARRAGGIAIELRDAAGMTDAMERRRGKVVVVTDGGRYAAYCAADNRHRIDMAVNGAMRCLDCQAK